MRARFAIRLLVLSLAVLSCGVASVTATPILVGTPGGVNPIEENCIPFGCPALFGIGSYQQVYSSTVFGGPTLISSITFFDTFSATTLDPNEVSPATYSLRLSTTAAAVNALSTTLPSNVGADDTLFFTGALGGPIGGPRLTFVGTPFLYDPTAGNLLLQVLVAGAGLSSETSFDADFNGGQFSRAFTNSLAGGVQADGVGLVTEFNTEAAPVPEPATLALVGSGVALLARARRRRTASR